MAIRKQDIGELAYGGLVTATKFFDNRRIEEGKLTSRDQLKKFSTYAYLVPGLGATIMSAFGTWRRYETWLEHISHGFMFGFPDWLTEVVTSMQTGSHSQSRAVAEAQKLVGRTGALTGARRTDRTYQPEFDKAKAW